MPKTDQSSSNNDRLIRNPEVAVRVVTVIVSALTAIAVTLPISLLKLAFCLNWLPFYSVESAWFHDTILLSTCGVMYNIAAGDTFSHLAYVFFIIMAGALAGLIALEISTRMDQTRPILKVSPIHILLGCFAGVFSDLIFVFIVISPYPY